ncbi:MAG: hypothetical protein ACOC91_00540 [bacterium]
MRAQRFLAAVATIAACVLLQACSESEEPEKAENAKPAETESGPSRDTLPLEPATTPAPEPIDACGLLSVQDVSGVLGHAMDGPETGPTAGGGDGEGTMSSCSFASRSESENAAPAELLAELNSTWFVNVTVWVWPEDGEGAQNYMNAMRDAPMTDEPVQEIEGLGEEAVWNGTLHARRDNVTVSLDVRPPDEADPPGEAEKERALMEEALEGL